MPSDSVKYRWLPWALFGILSALSGVTLQQLAWLQFARSLTFVAVGVLAALVLGGWCLLRLKQPLGVWVMAVLMAAVLFSRNADALIGLIVFVFACLSLGRVLGNWWKWPEGEEVTQEAEEVSWIQIGLYFFLGLGVNAYAIWIAMHCKVNYPLVYFLVLGGEIVLAREWLRALGARLWKQRIDPSPSAGQAGILLWTLLYLPYALVSFYVWDELGVHLYIPKVVSLYGKFMYDAKFPIGFDHSIIPKSTYTALFLMGGEMAVRLFNFLLFPAAFWLVEHFARNRWGRAVAFWSTLAALSTPFIMWQFGGVFIDSFALFSGTLLFLYAFHLAEHFTGKNILMYFVLGVLAYLSKQMAIYLLVPTGVWAGWLLLKNFFQTRRCLLLGYAFAGAGLFVLALAPLIIVYQRALGSSGLFILDSVIQKLFHLPPVGEFVGDGRWTYPLSWRLLFDLTFNGLRFTEIGRFSFGCLYFVFGLFFPLVFLNRKLRKDAVVLLLLFLGAGGIWLKLNGAYIRYFAGILPIGSVLLGLTITELCMAFRSNRWLARGGLLCVCAVFFLNFGLQLTFEGVVQPYPLVPALTGYLEHSSARFIREEIRVFEYAGIKYGKSAKCLAPGGKPMLYHANFQIQGLPYYTVNQTVFEKAANAEELFALIFLKERFDLIISPLPSGIALMDSPEFMNLVTREWNAGGYHLYIPKAEVIKRLKSS